MVSIGGAALPFVVPPRVPTSPQLLHAGRLHPPTQRQAQIEALEASLRGIDEEVSILRDALRTGNSPRAVRVRIAFSPACPGALSIATRAAD